MKEEARLVVFYLLVTFAALGKLNKLCLFNLTCDVFRAEPLGGGTKTPAHVSLFVGLKPSYTVKYSSSGPVEAASLVNYSIQEGLGSGLDPSFLMLQLAAVAALCRLQSRCCDLMAEQ